MVTILKFLTGVGQSHATLDRLYFATASFVTLDVNKT